MERGRNRTAEVQGKEVPESVYESIVNHCKDLDFTQINMGND